MALTIQSLKPVLQRLVDAARPGTKLPANLNDDNAIEWLSLIADFIAPEEEPEDQVYQLNEVGREMYPVEMAASRRSASRRVSRRDIADAKYYMKTGKRLK